MKKSLSGLIICTFLVVSGLLLTGTAESKTIELKMSHFMPTKHTQHKVMAKWAKKIEAQSNGALKVTIFPGGALGKPPHQYDNAVKGITDIAFGLQSYTAGRFPLTSSLRLPFLVKSGEQGSKVFWSMYEKYLKNEYKDVKVLWLFNHGPGQIHTTKKQVKSLEDLKGLKLRTPGAIMSRVLKRLGAVPVPMPITQVYTALERKTIDGICGPWEVMRPFKFYELIKYTTVADMYTLTFFQVMNKDKYDSLPNNLKKVIDNNIGKKMAVTAGKAYDRGDKPAYELCIKKGVQAYNLTPQERERWIKAAKPVEADWLNDMKAKGLPGYEVLDYAKTMLRQTQ
jgi:TRAP-type C4-dicarboxylate transport system substrate-binding protein